MRPAAAPTSTGRTASPSTPGPTVVTAPFLFEELWALCGRSSPTSRRCGRSTPFYRIRFDDGDEFDYTGDADAMRAEIARFSPGDVDGYERFMKRQRGDLPASASSSSATCPSAPGPTWRGSCRR